MPDQNRLRAELEQLYTESRQMGMLRTGSPITHMVDGALALIAREVRLGKIEELKTILFGAYGTDDISGRIKELEDE